MHKLRPSVGMINDVENHAILSQIRVIDIKRLVGKIGYLNRDIFECIRKTAKELL